MKYAKYHGLGNDSLVIQSNDVDGPPDGSESEKSGNGLRIFARFLCDQGLVHENQFTVETLGGTPLVCQGVMEPQMLMLKENYFQNDHH